MGRVGGGGGGGEELGMEQGTGFWVVLFEREGRAWGTRYRFLYDGVFGFFSGSCRVLSYYNRFTLAVYGLLEDRCCVFGVNVCLEAVIIL